jgi:hypothetical protein
LVVLSHWGRRWVCIAPFKSGKAAETLHSVFFDLVTVGVQRMAAVAMVLVATGVGHILQQTPATVRGEE